MNIAVAQIKGALLWVLIGKKYHFISLRTLPSISKLTPVNLHVVSPP